VRRANLSACHPVDELDWWQECPELASCCRSSEDMPAVAPRSVLIPRLCIHHVDSFNRCRIIDCACWKTRLGVRCSTQTSLKLTWRTRSRSQLDQHSQRNTPASTPQGSHRARDPAAQGPSRRRRPLPAPPAPRPRLHSRHRPSPTSPCRLRRRRLLALLPGPRPPNPLYRPERGPLGGEDAPKPPTR
jgi:hypothetical protein